MKENLVLIISCNLLQNADNGKHFQTYFKMKQKHSLSAEIYILLARFNFKEIVQKSSRFKVLCGLVRLISKYSLVRMRKKMYKYYARIFLKQFFSILRVQLWSVSILWDWKLLFHVNYFTNLPKILFWNRLCYIILIQVYIIFLMNDSHKLGPGITTYNVIIFFKHYSRQGICAFPQFLCLFFRLLMILGRSRVSYLPSWPSLPECQLQIIHKFVLSSS